MTKSMTIPLLLSVSMIILMLTFPELSLAAAKTAVSDFFSVIFPSLFPFMFGSTLLLKTGITGKLCCAAGGISQKLFGCGGEYLYIYLCSVLSGYPTGAKLSCDLFKEKLISKQECIKLINATSLSGPLFISGVVSVSVLGSAELFSCIFIPHILSAPITGVILKGFYPKNSSYERRKNIPPPASDAGVMIGEAFISCFRTSAIIFGYVIVFAVITKVLFSGIGNDTARSFFTGILEMSNGVLSLRDAEMSLQLKILAAECMVTFGGISVLMQTMSIVNAHNIKNPYFIPAKLIQTAAACALCRLMTPLFAGITGFQIPL